MSSRVPARYGHAKKISRASTNVAAALRGTPAAPVPIAPQVSAHPPTQHSSTIPFQNNDSGTAHSSYTSIRTRVVFPMRDALPCWTPHHNSATPGSDYCARHPQCLIIHSCPQTTYIIPPKRLPPYNFPYISWYRI